jgi:hypothetical protein
MKANNILTGPNNGIGIMGVLEWLDRLDGVKGLNRLDMLE